MKANDWLSYAAKKLETSGIGTSRLDALVLLEDEAGKDRASILANPEFELTSKQLAKIESQLKRRIKREPLAYIRGKTEFYGREFMVNKHVLEPRPESETMIDMFKSLKPDSEFMIIDVGTGSGALAITAKLEIPKIQVIATDIDSNCLKIARQNAKKHKVDIKFIQTDLLKSVNLPKNSILICNLPYVPDEYTINKAAMNEPKIAIFGGPDGLNVYRKLFEQINNIKNKPKYIMTESLPFQHKALASIAKNYGYKLAKTDDFIQLFVY